MKRDTAFAILSERYPNKALDSARDRARDKAEARKKLEERIEDAEGVLADIDECLRGDGEKTQITEFIEGERVRQYDDLCRLKHQHARLTSELDAEHEYIRRHMRVTEMMRGR